MGSDVCVYLDPSPPAGGDGPLGGVRVTVQPNLSVRDWPTEAGSKALERFVALEDATAVERLRAAGAAVVGSTRMSELGFGLAGDSSAAALAGNICDAALVTDTLGEARWAAAAAGAVGFKPSHGVVSRLGLIGLVPSMECLGVVAGSVERAAAVMAAVAEMLLLRPAGGPTVQHSNQRLSAAGAAVRREAQGAARSAWSSAVLSRSMVRFRPTVVAR